MFTVLCATDTLEPELLRCITASIGQKIYYEVNTRNITNPHIRAVVDGSYVQTNKVIFRGVRRLT